jgi:hypothetical protein
MATDPSPSLAETIATSASGPKSVSVEGMGSSTEHNLNDLIKADKYLAAKAAQKRVGGGIRFNKMSSGGAVR